MALPVAIALFEHDARDINDDLRGVLNGGQSLTSPKIPQNRETKNCLLSKQKENRETPKLMKNVDYWFNYLEQDQMMNLLGWTEIYETFEIDRPPKTLPIIDEEQSLDITKFHQDQLTKKVDQEQSIDNPERDGEQTEEEVKFNAVFNGELIGTSRFLKELQIFRKSDEKPKAIEDILNLGSNIYPWKYHQLTTNEPSDEKSQNSEENVYRPAEFKCHICKFEWN